MHGVSSSMVPTIRLSSCCHGNQKTTASTIATYKMVNCRIIPNRKRLSSSRDVSQHMQYLSESTTQLNIIERKTYCGELDVLANVYVDRPVHYDMPGDCIYISFIEKRE